MNATDIRVLLDRHWAASDAGDQDAEHDIYAEDVVVEYPQSGEVIRGRRNIQELRTKYPAAKRTFEVRQITGAGELWVTEYVLTYDGKPAYTVSIMLFEAGKVVHETQYFADPFEAPEWRASLVEMKTGRPENLGSAG